MHIFVLVLRLDEIGVVVARDTKLEEMAALPTFLSYQFLSVIVDVVDRSGCGSAFVEGEGAHHAVVAQVELVDK